MSGVTARARVTAVRSASGRVDLPELRSEGPLALRRTRAPGGGGADAAAQVTLVGAMAAPLGGDRLRIDVTVGEGAALRLTSAAATVALPGTTGAPACYDVTHRVGERARLDWLPEPLVSAAGSDLRTTTRVELAAGARLVLREELVLGRTGEPAGDLRSRLTVRWDGRPLLDQELALGPRAPGGESGAVLGGRRAVGQLLVVGQELAEEPVESRCLGDGAVLAPLAGPAALVTAVAHDALVLREALDELAAVPLARIGTAPAAHHGGTASARPSGTEPQALPGSSPRLASSLASGA